MRLELMARLIGMIFFAALGWLLADFLGRKTGAIDTPSYIRYILSFILAGGALGLLTTPWLILRPFRWFRGQIKQVPARHLLAGVLGLAIGLVISLPFAFALSFLPTPWGKVTPLISSLLFGSLGIAVLVIREEDLMGIIGSRFSKEILSRPDGRSVLLDTSVIIDGRIADISQTGFIEGTMLVPRFILDELQYIADSPDTLRRNRGRRGLDMLNKLQKESVVPIRITDMDVEDIKDVDGKLVKLAKTLRCPIVTNDYNLNRVAELQGVRVLNINELANAVKAVYLPGESLRIHLLQEGKEPGQGVGYLDDGTMVVVENGRQYIGGSINVVVTRVLQTVAGRMIFAHPEEKGS
ncbi:MAG: PIN/TRAM domain-containing protein [Anaerolineae bacterium]